MFCFYFSLVCSMDNAIWIQFHYKKLKALHFHYSGFWAGVSFPCATFLLDETITRGILNLWFGLHSEIAVRPCVFLDSQVPVRSSFHRGTCRAQQESWTCLKYCIHANKRRYQLCISTAMPFIFFQFPIVIVISPSRLKLLYFLTLFFIIMPDTKQKKP